MEASPGAREEESFTRHVFCTAVHVQQSRGGQNGQRSGFTGILRPCARRHVTLCQPSA